MRRGIWVRILQKKTSGFGPGGANCLSILSIPAFSPLIRRLVEDEISASWSRTLVKSRGGREEEIRIVAGFRSPSGCKIGLPGKSFKGPREENLRSGEGIM